MPRFRPPPKNAKRTKAKTVDFVLRLPRPLAEDLDRVLKASPGYSRHALVLYLLDVSTTFALAEIAAEARDPLARPKADTTPNDADD